jgi:sugar lactone lactonase YvrE
MIYDDTNCLLGEGPLWHPLRNQLYWFDILGRKLHTKGQHWGFDHFVSAAGWVSRDELLVASDGALSLFHLTSGQSEIIVPLEADNPLTRSNDGRADPFGGFWIGTMGIKAEPGAGSIWRYYRGELRKIVAGITVPNAICFSPDGTTAFFADSEDNRIMRQSLDPAHGWPDREPLVHIDLTAAKLIPDGAVVDAAGNLWNAQWQSGRVATYAPDGTFLFATDLPATKTTCPAFGGPDLDTLFCTSAAVDLPQSHIAAYPDSGRTFAVETAYKGQAEHRVIL